MVLLTWKDVLKSASMRLGAQSVTTFGVQMMEMLPASNLASQGMVCIPTITVYTVTLLLKYMVSRCSNFLECSLWSRNWTDSPWKYSVHW